MKAKVLRVLTHWASAGIVGGALGYAASVLALRTESDWFFGLIILGPIFGAIGGWWRASDSRRKI